jgi:imidazole glycerol-phosphate synthase subunit HisH
VIGVLSYGSGNVAAICNLLHRSNVEHAIAIPGDDLSQFSKFILPGVGAFDTTMELLLRSGFLDQLSTLVLDEQVPILGICVGMQVLARSSEEGIKPGLGWIAGDVIRFDEDTILTKPHLPHLGWNSIKPSLETPLFNGIDIAKGFYFLHSYHFVSDDTENSIATFEYGDWHTCAVMNGNVFGVQFHPEKSHANGVRLLTNFCELPC